MAMLIYSSGGAGQGEGPRSSRKGFDRLAGHVGLLVALEGAQRQEF